MHLHVTPDQASQRKGPRSYGHRPCQHLPYPCRQECWDRAAGLHGSARSAGCSLCTSASGTKAASLRQGLAGMQMGPCKCRTVDRGMHATCRNCIRVESMQHHSLDAASTIELVCGSTLGSGVLTHLYPAGLEGSKTHVSIVQASASSAKRLLVTVLLDCTRQLCKAHMQRLSCQTVTPTASSTHGQRKVKLHRKPKHYHNIATGCAHRSVLSVQMRTTKLRVGLTDVAGAGVACARIASWAASH